jgi:hypothetical protein
MLVWTIWCFVFVALFPPSSCYSGDQRVNERYRLISTVRAGDASALWTYRKAQGMTLSFVIDQPRPPGDSLA